jgi:hypothetical protein
MRPQPSPSRTSFPRAIHHHITARDAKASRTDDDRADLARLLREAIEADRYPLSPRVRRLKELLAKVEP